MNKSILPPYSDELLVLKGIRTQDSLLLDNLWDGMLPNDVKGSFNNENVEEKVSQSAKRMLKALQNES